MREMHPRIIQESLRKEEIISKATRIPAHPFQFSVRRLMRYTLLILQARALNSGYPVTGSLGFSSVSTF